MEDYIVVSGSRAFVTQENARELYDLVEKFILSYREKYSNETNFWLVTGGQEGFDEACAKIAMRNDIPYLIALSNDMFPHHYWGNASVLRNVPDRLQTFKTIKDAAQEIKIVSPGDKVFIDGTHTNHIRNQWMIDETMEFIPEGNTAVGLICQIGEDPNVVDFMKRARNKGLPYHSFDVTTKEFTYVSSGEIGATAL